MESRRMAMLGSGNVGRTLGAGLLRHGHEVVLGTRDVDQAHVREWLHAADGAGRAAGYVEAARWAEWVFLCVPGRVAVETARGVSAELAGKVVVDVTNRVASRDGSRTLAGEMNDSTAEEVQAAAPGARVVKAFNSTGFRSMVDPDLACGPPTMFVCGDDADAKDGVSELLRDLGWGVADLGPLAAAPLVEALGAAWVQYGSVSGSWTHAFKVLRP